MTRKQDGASTARTSRASEDAAAKRRARSAEDVAFVEALWPACCAKTISRNWKSRASTTKTTS